MLGVERRESFFRGRLAFPGGALARFFGKPRGPGREGGRGGTLPMSFTGEGWGGALVTLSLAGVSQRVEGNARQGAQNHGEGEFVKDEADQEAYAEAEHQAYREGTSRSGRVVVRKFRHERLLLGRLEIFFPPGV